jgi:hypothetical protein
LNIGAGVVNRSDAPVSNVLNERRLVQKFEDEFGIPARQKFDEA